LRQPVNAERSLSLLDKLKKTHIMLTYIKESIEELKNNASLPSRAESSNLMVVVAVFSILFALATWGVDTLLSKVIRLYFDNILN